MDRKELMKDFLAEMYRYAPEGSVVMACQFRGDPNDDIKGKWVARPVSKVSSFDDGANVYLAVSSMHKNERGEYRRRKENFAAGLLLMIDDIGTGPGSKFPLSLISNAAPTAMIETSPNNFQAVYMFSHAVTDAAQFEALVNGFIAKQFLGRDTGMAGINRVFRPPYGVNGKRKYNGHIVRAAEWNPLKRYHITDLAAAFGINLDEQTRYRAPRGATLGKAEGIKAFVAARQVLRDSGMLKRDEPDMAGWQDVICPWTENHTGGVNNGAGIREPAEENAWAGAFRCHHGSCEGKGWAALTDWISEHQEVITDSINRSAARGAFNFDSFRGTL
jgi:hypothetical protein